MEPSTVGPSPIVSSLEEVQKTLAHVQRGEKRANRKELLALLERCKGVAAQIGREDVVECITTCQVDISNTKNIRDATGKHIPKIAEVYVDILRGEKKRPREISSETQEAPAVEKRTKVKAKKKAEKEPAPVAETRQRSLLGVTKTILKPTPQRAAGLSLLLNARHIIHIGGLLATAAVPPAMVAGTVVRIAAVAGGVFLAGKLIEKKL